MPNTLIGIVPYLTEIFYKVERNVGINREGRI